MYIRASIQKHPVLKTPYTTYKLVESIRTERGPRQRIVLILGSDFSVPEAQWKDLANRIEEIVLGQATLFPSPQDLESLALTYARRIISKSGFEVKKQETAADYQTVDVNTVESEDIRTVGAEHVVYETMKELELPEKLAELGFNGPQQEAALGVIAGRLIHPSSERSTHLWLQEGSAIDELLETDLSLLSQDRVYKVSDQLLTHKESLEEHLRRKEKGLFNLEEQLILYDLTNTFFEGSGLYNDKARFGHSKDKRFDAPLVTLGLVIDGDGFPKRSKVFGGQVSEPTTLEAMVKELAVCGSSQPTVVMDAGIATEKNIAWLKEQRYHYLVVSRKKKTDLPASVSLVRLKAEGNKIVTGAVVYEESSGETILYCHSEAKEKKEAGIRSLFEERFESGLEKLRDNLAKKSGVKQYEKVVEKIGRLKERYRRVAHRYEVRVEKDDTNKATHITWSRKETAPREGLYILRSDRADLSAQELWKSYTALTDIEESFRCMKSELGLRPIHHQKEQRVDGHLFITVLAYHLLHTIRTKLRGKGISERWQTIRKRLSSQVRSTTTMKRRDGKVIHLRKSSRPEPYHRSIYEALAIPVQAGKVVKTIL